MSEHGPGEETRLPTVLDDRYLRESGRVFLTGVQALVRLPMEQARLDRAAGLRTGTFITGYPGSPLGGYDLALAQARGLLEPLGILHRPAANEETAATALTGTQMLERYPHDRCDGVVGFWYGKGPGLDRAGDAVRHGNYAGTTTHGAVVVLSGEDHEAKSSTMPFGQEHYFVHAAMPVLYPSSVAEFVELGLHAVALSRYAGLWVAMKLVGQLCDGGQTVDVASLRPEIALPDLRVDGRPFRKRQYHRFLPTETVETERVLRAERLPAAAAYAAANRLDRVVVGAPRDRLALVAAGKSFTDTRQALLDLGLDDRALEELGVRVVKVALLAPADGRFLVEALRGVEQVVVIEEKTGFLESRILESLYPRPDRPRVLGKRDEQGAPLFADFGGLDPDAIALRIGPRIAALGGDAARRRAGPIAARLAELRALLERESPALPRRSPTYCSGCPHSASTRVLPGGVAWSAPGCHVFATIIEQPERHADATFHLGGEGVAWIGLAPFTDRKHVVQNLGDGALFHSSYLNIRQAVAAGVSITFRILYNGAVANTGGQRPVGQLDVPTLVGLLALEGVRRIAVVSPEPRAYRGVALPAAATVHGRERLEELLAELEATPGVTVLLYDGECANERRRQERRALRPGATRFVLVAEEVCEDCGHCGALSGCVSLHKVETALGPKTRIHQSSCNHDGLCLEGECPSFVTVEVKGGGPRRPSLPRLDAADLPEREPGPDGRRLERPFRIFTAGAGGTGVLTVNSLLAWAALLDGKEVRSYDQTGAAQKWGAVVSSLVLAEPGQRVEASKVGAGQADLYLALDLMAAAERANLARCAPERTAALIHTSLFPSGEMARDPRLEVRPAELAGAVARACDPARTIEVAARPLAEALFGDHLAANLFALGVAWQAGLLPLSAEAVERAIAVNGTAAAQNLQAFRHGRLWRADRRRFHALAAPEPTEPTLAQLVAREAAELGRLGGEYRRLLGRCAALPEEEQRLLAIRVAGLIHYQSASWSSRYLDRVIETFRREREVVGPERRCAVTGQVVRGLYRLMAVKDEYEVARLHLRARMGERARASFDGQVRIHYQLRPPWLRALGLRRKLALGEWFEPVLRILASMRRLRGTALDVFGWSAGRRAERRLADEYLSWVEEGLVRLRPENQESVAELAGLAGEIRGYEEVRRQAAARAGARAREILGALRGRPGDVSSAAPAG